MSAKARYQLTTHPQSKRMYHIEFEPEVIRQFLDETSDVDVQQLEYVPYMRFMMARKLCELAGGDLKNTLRNILHDRNTGAFTMGLQGQTEDTDQFVKFATAISHTIGVANFDAMTGKYYARFTVKDTDNSDSYLRQAYRTFTLHTDGTFVDEATDWLLMMKMEERNAVGGESRLLHLDDWEDLEAFSSHPYATIKTTFKAPPSKNVTQEVQRSVFFYHDNKPCICFIDQFAYAENMNQAKYFYDLMNSLENSPSTFALKLPVGDMIVLNNLFWMHGRAAFEKHPDLYRELMRQRGSFTDD